ncbi:hypothetical protein D9611_014144 [Ephemerocybe angulata]|uniref:Uncharacterized protein n=1 Tax=Ephemerocybe angulata TaxID=980116 RepID=A0A8H5FEY3_9AGAR|nr:hypothetical protein D9611_014144 [Tulosesus angulatus]
MPQGVLLEALCLHNMHGQRVVEEQNRKISQWFPDFETESTKSGSSMDLDPSGAPSHPSEGPSWSDQPGPEPLQDPFVGPTSSGVPLEEESELEGARSRSPPVGSTGTPVEDNFVPGPGEQDPTLDDDLPPSRIEHVKTTDAFIKRIREASLDSDKLSARTLNLLRNPPTVPHPRLSPSERLSLSLYIDCQVGASDDVYNRVKRTIEEELFDRYPEGLLSMYRARKLMEDITGVVSVEDDMCPDGCHAFTGPDWENEDKCSVCAKPRWLPQEGHSKKKVAYLQMCTYPLGPQIQALRRSAPGSAAMQYHSAKVKKILENVSEADGEAIPLDDILGGSDLLRLYQEAGITEDDILLGFSIDGAQLYHDKKSDTWIAVIIIYNYDPATRYKRKHVLPALVIPGPNKPKNLDSFLFRTFYHISALQRENDGLGLKVWDYTKQGIIYCRPFFILGTADAVGLVELDGRVGHHGAHGCRLGCSMKGRHKPNSGHYYAVHLRPDGAPASDHGNFDFESIGRLSVDEYKAQLETVRNSSGTNDYNQNRKNTGISKPSIISALDPRLMLQPPLCFTVDLMHLLYNNIPTLFMSLWRGTMQCETTDSKESWYWATLTGEDWDNYGKDVEDAGQYFPSLFHRIPRNPALKISSSYKCTEYNLYFYKLGRVLFRRYLPRQVWRHYCLLVRAVDILAQRSITPEQIQEAHQCLVTFVRGYENMYYQRRADRLHFCRPAIHSLLHLPQEVVRVGPGAYSTQYTMENMIGDLGGEIRQHSTPFSNLKQIALRRCQLNALKVIYPEVDLDSKVRPPRGSKAVDESPGYVLLTPKARSAQPLGSLGASGQLIRSKLGMTHVRRWGRMALPNKQFARSWWSESRARRSARRVSRMVKLDLAGETRYAEVQFYFFDSTGKARAVVALFGPRHENLYNDSIGTIWACTYPDHDDINHLRIVNVADITATVAMLPFVKRPDDHDLVGLDLWYVAEKSGLEDTELFTSLENLNTLLGQSD